MGFHWTRKARIFLTKEGELEVWYKHRRSCCGKVYWVVETEPPKGLASSMYFSHKRPTNSRSYIGTL